jgi:hypothetical protein
MKPQQNYYPSNSSDGDYFYNLNCANCHKKSNCSILNRAMIGIKPKQWVFSEDNKPICTSLSKQKPAAKNATKNDLPRLF